jgi:lysine 2,3-aminomutase
MELIDEIRGFISGYGVPAFVIDAPGGGGKVQLLSNHIEGKEGTTLLLRNYEGKVYRYPDVPKGS